MPEESEVLPDLCLPQHSTPIQRLCVPDDSSATAGPGTSQLSDIVSPTRGLSEWKETVQQTGEPS